VRPLARRSCEIIRKLPNTGDLVFQATRGSGQLVGLPKIWKRILGGHGIGGDVTPHVLRHSFASLAADLGFSDSTIASLVGHKIHTVTSRYVHSADAVLLAAADSVADQTIRLMGDLPDAANVVPMTRKEIA
jgi:integrase